MREQTNVVREYFVARKRAKKLGEGDAGEGAKVKQKCAEARAALKARMLHLLPSRLTVSEDSMPRLLAGEISFMQAAGLHFLSGQSPDDVEAGELFSELNVRLEERTPELARELVREIAQGIRALALLHAEAAQNATAPDLPFDESRVQLTAALILEPAADLPSLIKRLEEMPRGELQDSLITAEVSYPGRGEYVFEQLSPVTRRELLVGEASRGNFKSVSLLSPYEGADHILANWDNDRSDDADGGYNDLNNMSAACLLWGTIQEATAEGGRVEQTMLVMLGVLGRRTIGDICSWDYQTVRVRNIRRRKLDVKGFIAGTAELNEEEEDAFHRRGDAYASQDAQEEIRIFVRENWPRVIALKPDVIIARRRLQERQEREERQGQSAQPAVQHGQAPTINVSHLRGDDLDLDAL